MTSPPAALQVPSHQAMHTKQREKHSPWVQSAQLGLQPLQQVLPVLR